MPLLSTVPLAKPKYISHKRYRIIKIIMFLDKDKATEKIRNGNFLHRHLDLGKCRQMKILFY